MAKITSWSGNSPHAREVAALERLKAELPAHWFGYANVFVKDPRKDAGQEVDLILVCDDRILMIDVKDWIGTVTQGRGFWYQAKPGRSAQPMDGGDPILKLFHANNALRSRMKAAGISPTPYVQNAVVFARNSTDFSDVAKHAKEGGKGRVISLEAFIASTKDPKRFDELVGKPPFESRPRGLGNKDGKLYQPIRNFFTVGRDFAIAEITYAGYRAKDQSISEARLWKQYEAESDEAHGDVGLLRLWDFDAEEGLSIVDADRETLVGREAGVQAFLRMHKTGRDAPTLAFKQSFNDGGAWRWELFQNDPDNICLDAFLARSLDDVPISVRKDLLESLLGAGAALAAAMVAHRDLGEHSVWIDLERRKISLSNLGAARVPETSTAGRHLPNLARCSVMDPHLEDRNQAQEFDVFRSDVHAFAFAGLKILLGPLSRNELDDNCAVFALSDETKSKTGIGSELAKWFEKALDPEQAQRFATCADAHAELVAALASDREERPTDILAPYKRTTPCMQDYPQNEVFNTSRPGVMEWRTKRTTGASARARLWLAPPSGQERSVLDFVRRGAALSILPPSIAPRIIECSIDAYGPFLCVEEISGKRLPDISDIIADLDEDGIARLTRKLAWTVLKAHDLGLAHGDLSPSNILVSGLDKNISDIEREPELRLIDWLDFSTTEAGPRENVAYGGDEADPFLRDRSALGKIVLELSKGSKASQDLIAAAQAFAAETASGDLPHWREISLADIDSLLAPPNSIETERRPVFASGLSDGEELAAEDGGFRVLFDDGSRDPRAGAPRATLVGSGVAAVVEFDQTTGAPCKAFCKAVTPGLEAIAGRHGERIEVRLIGNASIGLEGWSFLESLSGFERLSISPQKLGADRKRPILSLKNASGNREVDQYVEENKLTQVTAINSKRVVLNPLKTWETALKAEAETWPSATALSKPERVSGPNGLFKVEVEFSVDPARIEDGSIVYVRDRAAGKFDKNRSGEGVITISVERNTPWIREGDRLEFRNMGELSNIRRRTAALIKIAEAPQIPLLPSYFSENAPDTLGETATTGPKATDYGLNAPQRDALDLLWRRGPVSYLQGPPGTGKTKFIAAFVHHALTVGGAKNVLLTAQTHEAVDGAAARVIDLFRDRGEQIDLIRIASNAERVDAALKDAHAFALQERVREKFAAERAERVAALAAPLGIEPRFVRECAKILKGVVATAESVTALEAAKDNADIDLLQRMRGVLERQCETLGIAPEIAADTRLLRVRALEDAARRHDVRRKDAAGLILKLFEAANEYEEALGRRGALEPVFVRTRRLVCGTCVGLGDEKLGLSTQAFDLVVVDEAARAQGSELAIPLGTARKVLLVGDQKQLEPFLDPEATRLTAEELKIDEAELARSDFARAFDSPYGKSASALLDIQYRMAPRIGRLVSDVFYEGKLNTGREEPKSDWSNLPWPFDQELSWVDVAGSEISDAGRVRNEAEIEDIVESLERLATSNAGRRLLDDHETSGVSEAFIGVIAMYADQAVAIRRRVASSSLSRRWRDQIKIGTVDSYQGKENSIVLVSLVRDNPRGSIGFLRKENRINVALSRAKERLVVFGSQRMFATSDSKLALALSHPEFSERVAPLKNKTLAAE